MPFGPTFSKELTAAGLSGLPFSWEASGKISGRENLTASENTTLDAVIAAHNPAAVLPDAEIDLDTLNQALAQPGSVLRALAELQLEEANRIRTALRNLGVVGLPNITRAPFIDALRAKMR